MRKLRLDLEDLSVETFETAEAGRGRGTVHGRIVESAYCDTSACPDSVVQVCPDTGWADCGYSYGGTCGASPPVSLDLGGCDGTGGAPIIGGGGPYDCV